MTDEEDFSKHFQEVKDSITCKHCKHPWHGAQCILTLPNKSPYAARAQCLCLTSFEDKYEEA